MHSPLRAVRIGIGLFPAAIVLLIAAFLGREAAAQSMPPAPDPITTTQLGRYAEILHLSEQQRAGVLTAHDEYRERYRQFQQKEVQKYLDRLIDIGMRFERGRFEIPGRKELEALIDDYKKLLQQAQAIDRAFFDQISTSLSEDQLVRLPRAKTAREIDVFRVLVSRMAGGLNPGARVNMTDAVRELDLTAEEQQSIDPVLAEYETALLARTRDLYAAVVKGAAVVLDTIDQLNLRNMTPEQMMATMQDEKTIASLQTTFDEASKPFQEAASEASRLNLRTFRRIEPMLRIEQAMRLRDTCCQRGYWEAYGGSPEWRGWYEGALLLDELSSEQLQEIRAQRAVFFSQDNSLVDGVIDEVEDSRKYRSFTELQGRQGEKLKDKIDELQQRRNSLSTNAKATLDGILGPELAAQFDEKVKAKRKELQEKRRAEMTAQAAMAGEGAEEDSRPANREAFLPDPMQRSQLDLMASCLGMADDDKAVLGSAFDDYRKDYAARRDQPVVAASQPDAKPTSAEESQARRARYESLAKLDAAFFENIELLAKDDHQKAVVHWLAAARQRDVQDRTASLASWRYDRGDASSDPVKALLAANVAAADFDRLQPALQEHERRLAPLLGDRFEAACGIDRHNASLKAMQGLENNQKANEVVQKKLQEAYQKVWSLSRQIAELDKSLIRELIGQLPEEAAWAVRASYNRTAYPQLFREERVISRQLAKALDLPDLSEQQRDRVSSLSSDFRSRYFSLCDQIIDHREKADADNDGMPSREQINAEIASQQQDFDRIETCNRARFQLRLILQPEQVAAIPGLLKDDEQDND